MAGLDQEGYMSERKEGRDTFVLYFDIGILKSLGACIVQTSSSVKWVAVELAEM